MNYQHSKMNPLLITFSETKVTDEGLRALAAGLESHRGLQELSIGFRYTYLCVRFYKPT